MRSNTARRLASRSMHLNALIQRYNQRPNGTRLNLIQAEIDQINALSLPRYCLRFSDSKLYVYILNSDPLTVMPAWLSHVAYEIFQIVCEGSFTIVKSRERLTGLRVNGEGHEQASVDQ